MGQPDTDHLLQEQDLNLPILSLPGEVRSFKLSVTRNTSGRPGKQVGASSRIGSSQDEDLLGLHWGGQAWSQVGNEDGLEAEQGALEPALLLLLLQLRPQGNLPACPGGSTYFLILSQSFSQDITP